MSQRHSRRRNKRRVAWRGVSSSADDHQQNEQPVRRGAQSTDMSTAEDVIRFYYDSARKKYFRILPGQNSTIANAVTAESVKEKAAEEKRLLHLKQLCTPSRIHTSHVDDIASQKSVRRCSHNVTDLIFNTRLGQQVMMGQQKITECFIRGLRPCGSRKVVERSDEHVQYDELQHMSYMTASRDEGKLLCVWSHKRDLFQRIQLLHVKSFMRCHKRRAHKVKINAHEGSRIIVQADYQITGLTWTPGFSADNDHGDYILYTTSPFIGTHQSLAAFRRLDCTDPHLYHCEDFNLGRKATWCCAWNRHAKQFGVGSEGKVLIGDVETRHVQKLHADKSNVLSLTFSQQGSSLLYIGTKRGHTCTHDLRTSLNRCEIQLNHPSCVSCLHLMTDENYLLASDFSGEIRLWDIRQRAVVQRYEGNYNEYSCIPFHVDPHETILYTAGQDCYTRLWSLKTSRLLCTLPPPLPASRKHIPSLYYFSTMGRVKPDGCPGLLLGMLDELHYYSI